MTDEMRRFRVGVFVIAGFTLLVAGILAITAGRIFEKTHPVYVYFEESVQGLEPGSAVKFRGVEVGRVASVDVMPAGRIAATSGSPEQASLVEVRCDLVVRKISDEKTGLAAGDQIDAAIRAKVAQGLRVRIAWKDITGQKYLDLDFADPKTPPRQLPFTPPGTWIPTATERTFVDIQRDIATVASQLAQVDYKSIAQDVQAVLQALRKRAEEFEGAGLGARIGAAADAVKDLARNPRLDEAIARADETLGKLQTTAQRLDELVARPSIATGLDDAAASAASLRRVMAQLEDQLPKLTKSIDDTLATARRVLEESRLSETTASARSTLLDVETAARQLSALRETARKTLSDVGEAAKGVAQLVKYVEENPDALLHGKLEEAR
jgi:phospholipid/cholesterol/gamma-HCH transport system substrate-binding protein